MQVIFILSGLSLIVLSLVQLIRDIMGMFDKGVVGFEALSHAIGRYFPNAQQVFAEFITNYIWAPIWDPALLWVVSQPSFAISGVLGVLFIIISFLFKKRRKAKLAEGFY